MLVKHKAIVLHAIPYGDNSKVVKCFTDEIGLQSYLVNGVNNKKGVLKPSMVMPLTQLSLVAYHKNKGGLERIKEAKLTSHYQLLNIDPSRNAMAIFMAEILAKVCKEEYPNKALFEFIEAELKILDDPGASLTNFHIEFLLGLSLHLGFRPSIPHNSVNFFDMMEGTFETSEPLHAYYTKAEETNLLIALLENRTPPQTDKDLRLSLLDKLLEYYRIQLDEFGEVKSIDVLKLLF